jgi:maltooligosyltrehalose trehalohydrolase
MPDSSAQPSPTPQPGQPALFGPTVDHGGVTFRVWSPGARTLQLVLHSETPEERRQLFERDTEGYWSCRVDGLGGGARYRLQRDDRWPQPDPASHFQPEGVFGPSEVVDHGDFTWRTDSSWRGVPADELVLYELHVATFDRSGASRYDDVRRRLPELAQLGITGLKLMPLAACAGAHNWGYDGVFHLAPYAPYGTPEELRQLVDEAHGHGICVLVDVVTNHFGPEGNPMWQLSRGFFHRDANTAWGPGPRFDREAVLAYFEQMAWHFAQHYRVDGLRVDAVHAIPAAERRPHLERLVRGLERGAGEGRCCHLMLESVDNEASLLRVANPGVSVSQLNFDFQRATHRLLTGEAHMEYGEVDDEGDALVRCLERGFTLAGEFSPQRGRVVGETFDRLPWGTLVDYLVNHDTCGNRYLGQRLQELTSARGFRAATALLLLHPAVPYLFMGQEWASRQRFHFFTDFPEGLGRRVTKGRRQNFHEVDLDRCSERAPGPQEREALERSRLDWSERERDEHREHLALTRRLLELRREHRPQMNGSTAGSRCWREGRAFFIEIARANGQGAYLLAVNLGDEAVPLPERAGEVLFASEEGGVKEGELAPETSALLSVEPGRAT